MSRMLSFEDWNPSWPLWCRILADTVGWLLILAVSISAIVGSERMGHVAGGMGLLVSLRGLLGAASDWVSEWPARRERNYTRPPVMGVGAAADRSTNRPGNGR